MPAPTSAQTRACCPLSFSCDTSRGVCGSVPVGGWAGLTSALLAGYSALDQRQSPARPRTRRAGAALVVVGGMLGDQTPQAAVECLAGPEWEAARPMRAARAGAVAAVLGGKLYVAGGTGAEQAGSAPRDCNPPPRALRTGWISRT